jgi:hypothetical protein
VITSQLQLAIEQQHLALARFEEAGPEGPRDQADQASDNAYVLIRVARAGLQEHIGHKRFPDPTLQIVQQKLTDAWNRARVPGEFASWGMGRQRYFDKSVNALTSSIHILQQVLVLLP